MAGRRRTPVFTENFARNLDAIQIFLGSEGSGAFQRLLDRLFSDLVPTLCRYPQSGRSFFKHAVCSQEARMLLRRLQSQLERRDDLREFVMDDYLVLYLLRGSRAIFLSIKHHRQLSFDLIRFWL